MLILSETFPHFQNLATKYLQAEGKADQDLGWKPNASILKLILSIYYGFLLGLEIRQLQKTSEIFIKASPHPKLIPLILKFLLGKHFLLFHWLRSLDGANCVSAAPRCTCNWSWFNAESHRTQEWLEKGRLYSCGLATVRL